MPVHRPSATGISHIGLAAVAILAFSAATVSTFGTSSSLAQVRQTSISSTGGGPAAGQVSPNPVPASAHGTSTAIVRQSTTTGLTAQNIAVRSTTFQETSASIVYGGAWSPASHPGYLGRQALSSTRTGAVASLRFTGTGISWIGPTGPTRGKAKVYINGRLVKTVDTYSSRFTASRVLYSATYAVARPRTIRIEVLGTEGHPMVAVDALIVRTAVPATPPPDGTGSGPVSTVPPPTVGAPAPPGLPGQTPVPSSTPSASPGASPSATPEPSPTPEPTPNGPSDPSSGSSIRVTSIPALLNALDDNNVTEIVVANGSYQVTPSSVQGSNALWIGSRFADRTQPVTIRAESSGGVVFDGGGTSSFGGMTFAEGAHHQTWDGFTFANGTPNQTGVIVFGGYAGRAAPHHITLRNITIPSSVTSSSSGSTDHGVYFSLAQGGPHDILIDGLTVDGRGGLDSALQFFHSDGSNPNAWNITVRRMQVFGTETAVVLWDGTIHDIVIEDSTIIGAERSAISYERGGTVTIRRVTSSGSGLDGFTSSFGSSPPGVTFIDSDLR